MNRNATTPTDRRTSERRPVLLGENRPDASSPVMSKAAALRHAERIMPADLRRAGFIASIFSSDPEIHGGSWFRINYGKTVPA